VFFDWAQNSLSPEQYDAAETRACAQLSIPHLMAFRPVAYQSVGWPIRVTSEAELVRYADHNFEHEVPGLFAPDAVFPPVGYRNAFTPDEKELIDVIRDRVAAVTERCGRRIRPITNLLVQTGPFRMLNQLAEGFRVSKLAVFEVGPGAGYLGALLAQTGHRYLTYDVTQSYYLWQNRLLAAVAGRDFSELAGQENTKSAAAALQRGRVVHLPWWTYAQFLANTPVRTDVVYSNSNLSEMTRVALRHVLHISRQMLQRSPIGVFCFFSKGMPSQTPHEELDSEFERFGYEKVMDEPFHAFVTTPERAARIRTLFEGGLRHYAPSGRPATLTAKDVVPLYRNEAPLDVHLTQWLMGWQPPFRD